MKCQQRTCGYNMGEYPCEKPMVVHLQTISGLTTGVCAEHRAEVLDKPWWVRSHPTGPDCCMPGSVWYYEENVCRYEEDELLVGDLEEKELELVG